MQVLQLGQWSMVLQQLKILDQIIEIVAHQVVELGGLQFGGSRRQDQVVQIIGLKEGNFRYKYSFSF